MKENPLDRIPEGPYCHFATKADPCPYWEMRDDKPKQENGYCNLFKFGDWEDEGTSLLWDMVKECDINHGWDEDDIPPLTDEQIKELDRQIEQVKKWEKEGTLGSNTISHEELREKIMEKINGNRNNNSNL